MTRADKAYSEVCRAVFADIDQWAGTVLACTQDQGRGTPNTDRQCAYAMGHFETLRTEAQSPDFRRQIDAQRRAVVELNTFCLIPVVCVPSY